MNKQLLVRVDYDIVLSEHTSTLRSLRTLGIESIVGEAALRGRQEAIVRHWLAYVPL